MHFSGASIEQITRSSPLARVIANAKSICPDVEMLSDGAYLRYLQIFGRAVTRSVVGGELNFFIGIISGRMLRMYCSFLKTGLYEIL